mmetsp:Transcript_107437/g.269481  ORF Transcript_107437/g.269481 Transcript_107437/m.269481 type:complete len:257 (+) Transcript_107437:768-1538(+)
MNAMDTATGTARVRSSKVGMWISGIFGNAAKPPAKVVGSFAFCANVGTSKLSAYPAPVATARPTSDDGIGADGKNCVITAQIPARAAPCGVERAPSCDMRSAMPRAFRNPASTSAEMRSKTFAKPTKPARNSRIVAMRMMRGTSSRPWALVKTPSGTTTTAAEPAMTPGRMPTKLVTPRDTEDHKPAKALVPTMELQAMAFGSNEKATLMPASTSSTGLGSLIATVLSSAAAACGIRSPGATAPGPGCVAMRGPAR